ncbi:MAG TPA: hypothetical protein PLC06_15905 [Promineifilum sp.]|nr:hypothetical protein [Promineifilum sp.]
MNNSIVKIHANPGPFLKNGKAFNLGIEPSVLDGHGRMSRQHLDQALIGIAEFIITDLVGQIEVAQRFPRGDNRHAKKIIHKRVTLGHTDGSRVSRDMRHPDRLLTMDHLSQKPFPQRPMSDFFDIFSLHPTDDKTMNVTRAGQTPISHGQRRILCAYQVASRIDDQLQDLIYVKLTGYGESSLV